MTVTIKPTIINGQWVYRPAPPQDAAWLKSHSVPEAPRGLQCECGDHYWAQADKGFVLMVSPEDAALLNNRWNIFVHKKKANYVTVSRGIKTKNGRQTTKRLHSQILHSKPGMQIDHKNLNTLDNRRPNLRHCTPQQNSMNKMPYRGKAVPLKGVQRVKWTSKFIAVIVFNKKWTYLGSYETAEEAHAVYVAKARELHGEFFCERSVGMERAPQPSIIE